MSVERRWSGEWCVKHPERMATGAIEGKAACDECCLEFFSPGKDWPRRPWDDDSEGEGWRVDGS